MGGIKEKLIGALRAGVKTVLLPAQNRKDVKDLPQEVKDGLNIIHVRYALPPRFPHPPCSPTFDCCVLCARVCLSCDSARANLGVPWSQPHLGGDSPSLARRSLSWRAAIYGYREPPVERRGQAGRQVGRRSPVPMVPAPRLLLLRVSRWSCRGDKARGAPIASSMYAYLDVYLHSLEGKKPPSWYSISKQQFVSYVSRSPSFPPPSFPPPSSPPPSSPPPLLPTLCCSLPSHQQCLSPRAEPAEPCCR